MSQEDLNQPLWIFGTSHGDTKRDQPSESSSVVSDHREAPVPVEPRPTRSSWTIAPATTVGPHPAAVPDPAPGPLPTAQLPATPEGGGRPSRQTAIVIAAAVALVGLVSTVLALVMPDGKVGATAAPAASAASAVLAPSTPALASVAVSTPEPTDPGKTGSPSELQAARSMETLLVASGRGRRLVASASATLPCDATTFDGDKLDRGLENRQQVYAAAEAADLTGLPEGEQLRFMMVAFLGHSISADRHYIAQFENGSCQEDGEFQLGNEESGAARADKKRFLENWNRVAVRLDLRQFTDTQI